MVIELRSAASASTEAPEQGEYRLETGWERRQILEFIGNLSQEWGTKSNQLSVRLLRALIRLSLADPIQDGFTSLEVAEEMDREKRTSWLAGGIDPDKIRASVRDQFKVLQGILDEKAAGIAQRLAEQGSQHTICLHKLESKGGSGNQSRYGLTITEISPADRPPMTALPWSDTSLPVIAYTTDDVVTSDRLTKLFAHGVQMRGVYRFVFLAFILAMVVVAAIFGLALALQLVWPNLHAETRSVVLTFAILLSVVVTLYAILSLPDKRIVMAPFWLQGDDWGCVLQWSRQPGQPSIIQVVRYGATCPICGGAVRIRSGEFRFYGRLVGTCAESPREHIYSFDHVMRRGKLLVL